MYLTCTSIGPFIWNAKKTGYVLQQITSTSGTCDIAALPSLPDITDDIFSHHALQLMLTNQPKLPLYCRQNSVFVVIFKRIIRFLGRVHQIREKPNTQKNSKCQVFWIKDPIPVFCFVAVLCFVP
jgi:hypothetical protein